MNILLIAIDTLRADHLSCYGYNKKTSPNIDKEIAQEGIIFENFFAPGIPTHPGFTTIFTGLHPLRHKIICHAGKIILDRRIPTLPEILYKNNYTTAAIDNLIMTGGLWFARGFEYYINVTGTSKPMHHLVRGDQINRRLIQWLRNHKDEKFFILVHYWDPHTPYNQPEEFKRIFKHEPGKLDDLEVRVAPAGYQYVPGWGKVGELWEPKPEEGKPTIDLYDGEIRFVDSLIGEVSETLEELDLADETVIVITSDHGEQLGQHGLYDHRGPVSYTHLTLPTTERV